MFLYLCNFIELYPFIYIFHCILLFLFEYIISDFPYLSLSLLCMPVFLYLSLSVTISISLLLLINISISHWIFTFISVLFSLALSIYMGISHYLYCTLHLFLCKTLFLTISISHCISIYIGIFVSFSFFPSLFRPGEGSSLSEERQAFRSSKEKQVKESTPLNERTPSSASEPGIGSSPFTRTENFSPAVRFGVDTQGLSSMEDDGSFKGGARYKRAPDMGNIRATSWKGVNAWPAPGVNGFIPFQHIPPPHGYLNQFPPSLFGVRPGVPFHHLHEPRPYIWPNPSDNWDDDPHVYGRLPVTWEMKTQTQTQTQAVDVVPVKESEPLTTNDQAMSPVESEETRESQERIHVAASKNEVNTSFCTVYLSRLDISPYLAGSELHKQCVDLVGVADMAQTNPRFCRSRLKVPWMI